MKHLLLLIMLIANFLFAENEGPSFENKKNVKDIDGKNLLIGLRASPTFFDWDEDGLKDMMVGTVEGNVKWYKNRGTIDNPGFKDFEFLFAGDDTLVVAHGD